MFLDYSEHCLSKKECFFNECGQKKDRFMGALRRGLYVNRSLASQIGIF